MGIAYTVFALVVLCLAQEPAILIAAFFAFWIFEAQLDGVRIAARALLWKVALLLTVMLFNCLFATRGATHIFDFGILHITLEGIVFGFCMGLMLVDLIMLFNAASHFVSVDEVLDIARRRFPNVSLVLSTVFYLVPHFKAQLSEVRNIEAACSAKKAIQHSHARGLIVVFSSAIEDAFIRAQSMRARGWREDARARTVFRRNRPTAQDKMLTVFVIVLGIAALACTLLILKSFAFYPNVSFEYDAFLLVPVVLFFALPCIGYCAGIAK